jgi:hypothetical protein
MTLRRKDRKASADAVFSILGYGNYYMKTTIYIDGYNLYYGLIKNTKYKWLDLQGLFSQIAKIQTPVFKH